MICCTTVATLLDELRARSLPGLWLLVSWCDAVQLRRTALVRWTSQRIPWELMVLFSSAVLPSHGCSLDMTLDEGCPIFRYGATAAVQRRFCTCLFRASSMQVATTAPQTSRVAVVDGAVTKQQLLYSRLFRGRCLAAGLNTTIHCYEEHILSE
jgi:hypothetical protein